MIIPQLWELGIKSRGLVARGCLGGTGTGWCRGAGGSGGAGGLWLGSWWGASLETPPFATTMGGCENRAWGWDMALLGGSAGPCA